MKIFRETSPGKDGGPEVEAVTQLHAIVDAWEALPGGRRVRDSDVEEWLAEDLAPAINAIRGFLRRPKPDGTVPLAPHGDDIAVDRFSAAMKAKLSKKRDEGRGGWESKDQCTAEFLSQLLREHVEKGDPLDVGNLAMMLHQRGERISPPSPQSTVDADAVIERCAMAADAEGSRWTKDEASTAFGQAYQHACANVSVAIRALKAKSPSSDRAASEGKADD